VYNVARGLLWGDLDNDGGVDLVVTSIGGPVRVFRNVAPQRGHWLAVQARVPCPTDAKKERDAIGAEVTVHVGGEKFARLIYPTESYLSSNDLRAHFGLGTHAKYDKIAVVWPNQAREEFPGGACDQQLTLRQGSGKSLPKDTLKTPGRP
jgi:hypothetical protein